MNQYSTQHLDHLGIIAGTFNLLNIQYLTDELDGTNDGDDPLFTRLQRS